MTKIEALRKVFSEVRASTATWNRADESIYSFYRWFVRDAKAAGKLVSVAADPADELRSELRVAARTAQQFGATEAQINYIVSLATKTGNFNVLSGGRLTKADASHIINAMK
jgi:hypothetical protein